MTPDLMDEGARRIQAKLAPAALGQTESGGRTAGFSRIATPGEVDITHGRILYLEDVNVSFDGFKAINNLSLDIAPGELRCIIGPNGAGKTTMMDIITGKTRPDKGTVFFGSTIDLLRYREPEIAALGIGRKFQKPTVFEALSVQQARPVKTETERDSVMRELESQLSGFDHQYGNTGFRESEIMGLSNLMGLDDDLAPRRPRQRAGQPPAAGQGNPR